MVSQNASSIDAIHNSSLEKSKEEPAQRTPSPGAHSDGDVETAEPSNEESDYVTGFTFGIVMISVTMAAFLLMLDTSIIATVSQNRIFRVVALGRLLTRQATGHSPDHQRISLLA